MSDKYRSVQQIAAVNLHKDFDRILDGMARFAAITTPSAHTDTIEKVRKAQRRLIDYMHKEDKPK